MIINKNNFKNNLLSRLITTILIILFFSLLIHYSWKINWHWFIINILILISISVIVNVMDWYLQLYIIKNDKQKFLFKIMKNRTYSQNFSSLTEQTSIVVNLKREWIYYCSVLSVYFILIMPLLLISLNNLSLITKLMLMILIFIFYLLLNLYKVSYNNQHIILKYNEELNKKQETSKNFIKIKTKNKYVLNKIINFIPLYLSIFGLIAYIVLYLIKHYFIYIIILLMR